MKLGIDFGTCNSSATILLNGVPKPIKEPIKQGYSFPSSVFAQETGEILVGQAAENLRLKNQQCYRREFKRDLGSRDPYMLGNRSVLPEDLVTEVIRKLKTEADKLVQNWQRESLTHVVVTVPATYQPYKRRLMEDATRKAGFSHVELLDEPIAAAIYYANREQVRPLDTILVYDLGGGTFDATLIQKEESGYKILTMPKGLPQCGGTDFDREIYQELKSRSSPTLQQRLTDKEGWLARAMVLDLCRNLKHQLSETQEATVHIPLGIENVEPFTLNRQAFNRMIKPSIDETLECCEQLLRSGDMNWSRLQHVLLVGGSCRIPYVHEAIQQRLGRAPLLIDEPELAVCFGAALYGTDLQEAKTKNDSNQITAITVKDTISKNQKNQNLLTLENALSNGKWKDADQETLKALLTLIRRKEQLFLEKIDIKNIFEEFKEELKEIDKLWVKYSQQRFGFSIQSKIYKSYPNFTSDFCYRVGWREQKGFLQAMTNWKTYEELTFTLDAPKGHLPFLVHTDTPVQLNLTGRLGIVDAHFISTCLSQIFR